jgi:prolyl oligopeptidase
MEWRRRNITFYTSKSFVRFDGESDWHALPIQDDAQIGSFADQLLITLRSSWEFRGVQYSAGAVLAIGILDLLASSSDVAPVALFAPEPRISLDGLTVTLNYVIVVALENVKSRITFWKYDDVLKAWSNDGCEASASIRGISLAADDDDRNDLVWLTFSTFLTPSSLSLMDARRGAAGILEAMTAPVKTLPAQFDSSGLEEQQGFATSKDGEQIPYFLVRKKGGAPKETPCLLYGYGGFEISLLPSYLGAFGAAWLEKGFTYVIANIRGGGEFGPDWHKAALQTNRNKAYEDFIAVAEDLVSKGIASNQHLGIRGGSNGGLLMGNMYVMRPDLFKAVVCQVPLLDMRRYNKLLAGASWMAEYGKLALFARLKVRLFDR